MQKGKIVYLGGFELPDKNAAAHRVLSIGKIFESIGYETIYCGIYKSSKPNYNNKNFYAFKYPISKIEWLKYLINYKQYIIFLKNISNIKLVVLYNFPSYISLKIHKYCKKNNIKCVSDITEWYHSKTHNIMFNLVKNIDSNVRMKFLNKRMDGLIVISSFLKKYYKELNNIVLIPPLVDVKDEKWKITKSESNNDNLIKFLYTGDPGKKDKMDVIIKLLNDNVLNENYVLNILGITKEQFLTIYDDFDDNVLTNNVIFHGRVPHEESLKFLKSCDALIFYRDDNIVSRAGFPTKYVESVTCGVPVITNFTSDLSSYLKDKYNGIVLDNNFEGSSAVIKKVSKKELKVLKKNIDKDMFDYRKYIDSVKEWLNNL